MNKLHCVVIMIEDKITAFPNGNSFVRYHPAIEKLVIGNSEGLIKIFNINEPDLEPVSIDINENLTSLSFHSNSLLVTNTAGNLELINLNENESKGTIYRSELPLRDSVFINEGKRLLCGGDDNKLVLIDMLNDKSVSTLPIPDQLLNMAYNMTGEILSLSLSNGNIQIYSVINEVPNLIETITSILPVKINSSLDTIDYIGENNDELISTKTQWSSNGESLLIPTSSNSIKVYDRSSWTDFVKEFKLDHSDVRIVDFELSPNNKHLAVGYKDLTLKVFDFNSKKLLKDVKLELQDGHYPTNLIWSEIPRSSNYNLCIGTTNGCIVTYSDLVGKDSEPISGNLFLDEAEESDANNTDDLFNDSDDEEQALAKPNGILHEEDSLVIDQDDEDENDNNEMPDYYNKDVDSYLDERRSNKRFKLNGSKYKSPSPYISDRSSENKEFELQPYSPGSTPWSQSQSKSLSDTDRRYLAMNSIGYIWSVKTASNPENLNQQSITISFFDRSINKDYHFIDYYQYDLCSMNEKGVLLACSGYKDKTGKLGGKVLYRFHDTVQDSWERNIPLLKDEFITSVSLTNNSRIENDYSDALIIIGTNLGYVRFFNLHGLCINLIKTPPVVTLMASSSSIIFMINQISPNVYTYSIIDVNQDYKFIQQDVLLPLKKCTKYPKLPLIKGIFFNEYNDPCLVPGIDDTVLILSTWRETNNAKWIPILNCKEVITENGNSESKKNWKCWPLGLYKDQLNCLILKTDNQYPGFPLPLPIELDIKLPVTNGKSKENEVNGGTDASKNEDDAEETFLRASTMGRIVNDSLNDGENEEFNDEILERLQNYSMIFDKSLLKLFASACQESRLNKALSIAKLIKNDKALMAASKISERLEFLNLASKISKLREDLVNLSEGEDDDEN